MNNAMEAQALANSRVPCVPGLLNPTLRENIDAKIKYHEQEIVRLRLIETQIPEQMLKMNLRDLHEAMSY